VARGFIQGYVERGGENVTTDGRVSTTDVQRSFPGATVTVYDAGTLTPSTIFSTEAGAPLANPFTADTDGHWGFWANQARYDVKFSGAGITTPYTLFNLETVIAAGLVDPGSNGILARIAPNTLAARTILGTTSAITVSNGDGSANPVINLDSGLNFSGKTITGGTYLAPIIASFINAQHTHQDAVGGGQLNATSVFNAGTVPVARLPLMVGASGIANGVSGLVPQPNIGDQGNFLRGDGVWATAGGGGGGTPGGANTTVQYNNAGAFGGVSGATSDGTNITFGSTNLRATRPRIITSIDDTNGNEVIGLISTGSAINEISITNAASGGHPVISATGGGTDINIALTPKGAGIITTTGNLQITNNAPQIVLIDANDSKTVRISLNGANWAFINDTAGATPINIDTTTSAVTLVSDLFFSKASTITISRPSNTDLQLSNTTGVFTFGQIPVGPNSDPTTGNQLTRKTYVDNRTIPWSVTWFVPNPSIVSTGVEEYSSALVPANSTAFTITRLLLEYRGGSHTAGAFVRFKVVQRGSVSQDLGTIEVNDTNNSPFTLYVVDIADVVFSSGDRLVFTVDGKGGTVTERNVSIFAEGFRKVT